MSVFSSLDRPRSCGPDRLGPDPRDRGRSHRPSRSRPSLPLRRRQSGPGAGGALHVRGLLELSAGRHRAGAPHRRAAGAGPRSSRSASMSTTGTTRAGATGSRRAWPRSDRTPTRPSWRDRADLHAADGRQRRPTVRRPRRARRLSRLPRPSPSRGRGDGRCRGGARGAGVAADRRAPLDQAGLEGGGLARDHRGRARLRRAAAARTPAQRLAHAAVVRTFDKIGTAEQRRRLLRHTPRHARPRLAARARSRPSSSSRMSQPASHRRGRRVEPRPGRLRSLDSRRSVRRADEFRLRRSRHDDSGRAEPHETRREEGAGHRQQQGHRPRHRGAPRAGRRGRRHQLQQRSEGRGRGAGRGAGARPPRRRAQGATRRTSTRCASWWRRASAALGGLDILVNNAGIEKHAAFWDVTEADFDAVLDVNLKGVFFATQAFVRACRRSGRGGKVINISSVHEELAFPNFAAYCASKGGMRMLTRTLAVELGPLGITDQQHRARRDRDADQREAAERSGQAAGADPPDSARPPRQARRRRRPRRVPRVIRQRLRHRLDLLRRRRADRVLSGEQ